jgi:hypothetical protein
VVMTIRQPPCWGARQADFQWAVRASPPPPLPISSQTFGQAGQTASFGQAFSASTPAAPAFSLAGSLGKGAAPARPAASSPLGSSLPSKFPSSFGTGGAGGFSVGGAVAAKTSPGVGVGGPGAGSGGAGGSSGGAGGGHESDPQRHGPLAQVDCVPPSSCSASREELGCEARIAAAAGGWYQEAGNERFSRVLRSTLVGKGPSPGPLSYVNPFTTPLP